KAQHQQSQMNPNDKQFLFSNFLDQGRLIEFHDLEGIRIGIRSLNAQEVDLILFQYKLEPTNDILKEAQAPSLFAKKFLYSVSGKILSAKEREELADSL